MSAYKDSGGRWRYRRRIQLPDGRRTRIKGTPTTNTKRAAEAAERAHILRLENPHAVASTSTKEVPTCQEYSDLFLNTRGADHKARHRDETKRILERYLLPVVGELRLDEINQATVDLLRRDLLSTRSPKTVANILAVLSSLLKYAARNGEIEAPRRIRFDVKGDDSAGVEAVDPADIDRLVVAATDQRYRVAILLAAQAGLRQGEIRALEWADIEPRIINVRRAFDTKGRPTSTKGRRSRRVGLSPALSAALAELEPRGATVITKRASREPLSYWAMRDGVLAIYGTAGVVVPSQPWHALRHSYGTALARAGVPVEVVRKAMGHKSIATTLRYFHTDDRDLVEAAGVFDPKGPQLGPSTPPKGENPREIQGFSGASVATPTGFEPVLMH